LPGVLRAEFLAQGLAREAILRLDDLDGGFILGNALRGQFRASLSD
jgi:para-aminobenzoate synthetase/4-amino-4-deoxychorismate lyase